MKLIVVVLVLMLVQMLASTASASECPLPKLVPRPSPEEWNELAEMGIMVTVVGDCDYCPYTIPEHWTMVDLTKRPDLPRFAIVDQHRLSRVTITGVWRGWYDHKIFYQDIHVTPPRQPSADITILSDDALMELVMDTVDIFMQTHSVDDENFDALLSAIVDQAVQQAEIYILASQIVKDPHQLQQVLKNITLGDSSR